MEWDTFFHGLSSFLLTTGDREAGATSGVAEFVLSKISNYLHVLYAMETTLREGNGGDEELIQLATKYNIEFDQRFGRDKCYLDVYRIRLRSRCLQVPL